MSKKEGLFRAEGPLFYSLFMAIHILKNNQIDHSARIEESHREYNAPVMVVQNYTFLTSSPFLLISQNFHGIHRSSPPGSKGNGKYRNPQSHQS